MSEPSSRTVLNHLIETCRDGERGFLHAAELVGDPALKTLFGDIARHRAQIASALQPHAERLGGAAAAEGTTAASMHRRWMDVRSRLAGHDDRAIIAEAQRGDTVTMTAFKDALAGFLPASVRDLVELQYTEVQHAHEDLARTQAD